MGTPLSERLTACSTTLQQFCQTASCFNACLYNSCKDEQSALVSACSTVFDTALVAGAAPLAAGQAATDSVSTAATAVREGDGLATAGGTAPASSTPTSGTESTKKSKGAGKSASSTATSSETSRAGRQIDFVLVSTLAGAFLAGVVVIAGQFLA